MSLTSARDAIVGLVATQFPAAYPGMAIAYDNSPFDWANTPEQFVYFEVEFHDANQINIAVTPKTRDVGFVYVTVFTRTGKGSKTALGILDWFRSTLAYKNSGSVQLREGKPDNHPADLSGYHRASLKVPFHSDGH